MEVIIQNCAGLDVHKETVEVAARWIDPDGKARQEVRRFSTFTGQLLELSDWLKSLGVTHIAMESTGVFWKPIYNIMEGDFEILLVNARHVKNVPGRKTDVSDCQWLAQLLQHGLLRGSFIPPREQRELRDLTRHRTQLISEKTRVGNRIQKTLEDANIKLGSVASDVLGMSGRSMLAALVAGEPEPFSGRGSSVLVGGAMSRQQRERGQAEVGADQQGQPVAEGALIQAAHAAGRTRKSYFPSHFKRIARKRGMKRAAVAVGHSLLVVYYHLLTTGECYEDLGADFFDRQNPDQLARYCLKRLDSLGVKVTLENQEAA